MMVFELRIKGQVKVKALSLSLKVLQFADERQPNTEAEAVLQVTAPFECVNPVENVVVAALDTNPP